MNILKRIQFFNLVMIFLISFGYLNAQTITKAYYENGNIKLLGEKIKGKKEGVWKEYYENGNLRKRVGFKSGIKDGVYREFYENGNGKTYRKYNQGKLVDTLVDFFENKSLSMIYIVKTGEKKQFYENRVLAIHGFHKIQNLYDTQKSTQSYNEIMEYSFSAQKIGEWKKYYKNGNLRSIITYADNGQGLFATIKNATCRYYYDSGELDEVCIYKNGKKNGARKIYFKNGNLKQTMNYENNLLNGKFEEYYQNGDLKFKGNFVNDKIDGLVEIMYPDNRKDISVIYKEGRLINVKYKYLQSGGKVLIGSLKDGNGSVFSYNDEGIIIDTIQYKNGVKVKNDLKSK